MEDNLLEKCMLKNPKLYLDYNEKNVKDLNELGIMTSQYYDNIKKIYKDKYMYYDELMNTILEEIKSLRPLDNIEELSILTDLIWAGVLSNNMDFKFDKDVKGELSSTPLKVVEGRACCRNLSYVISDYLKLNHIETYNIACNPYEIDTVSIDLYRDRFDSLGKRINHNLFTTFNRYYGNKYEVTHMNVLFDNYGKYLLYDPTNITYYKVKGYEGKMITGSGKILIQPSSMIVFDKCNYDEMYSLYKTLLHEDNNTKETEIIKSFNNGLTKEYDINKIHDKVKKYIKKISD